MEASHKTYRPHIKVGKDEEKKKKGSARDVGITGFKYKVICSVECIGYCTITER